MNQVGWILAALGATAALAYVASSSSSPTPAGGAPGGGTQGAGGTMTLTLGHRYSVSVVNASALVPQTDATVQAALSKAAPGFYTVVGGSTTQQAPNQILYAVDVVGPASGSTNPTGKTVATTRTEASATFATAAGAAAGAAVTLTDQGPSPGAAASWQRASVINPGDHVRASLEPAAFQTIALALNMSADKAGWIAFLALPPVADAMASANVLAWGPGDPLPTDWPSDDTAAATEFHVDFVYQSGIVGGSPTAPNQAASPLPGPVPVAGFLGTIAPGAQLLVWTTPGTPPPALGGGGGTLPGAGAIGKVQIPPSTTPQTVTLSPATSVTTGQGQPVPIEVSHTLPGTPITLQLSPGGFFNLVTTETLDPTTGQYTLVPQATATHVLGTFYSTQTPSQAGRFGVLWRDSTGAARASIVNWS